MTSHIFPSCVIPLMTEEVIQWNGVRKEPSGTLAATLLERSVIDTAANSGDLGRFWDEVASLCPQPGIPEVGIIDTAENRFWDEIGPYIEYWKTRDRFVGRAWLCLAVLGRGRQRPGGYTTRDVGGFALVRSRGAARRVVGELVDLGVLLREESHGRQPRYRYTRAVHPELGWTVRNEWHRQRIRRLLRIARGALPGRDASLPSKSSAGTGQDW